MKVFGFIIVLATALTLQGCSSDSNHHSVSNEAVYPADIESLHATYYNEADGSEKQTVDLEISYADDGKIDDQMIITSLGGTPFYTSNTLYNSNGDVEQRINRDDLHELTDSAFYSYNTLDDLIESYRIVNLDDPTAPQRISSVSYTYDDAGNNVYARAERMIDNAVDLRSTSTSTYNSVGNIEARISEHDTDGDDVIDVTETESFSYDGVGRLTFSERIMTGTNPSETTTEYSYNSNGLLEEVVKSYDDESDGQLDSTQISTYLYVDKIFPSQSTYTYIDYAADQVIIAQHQRVITYSYDSDHFLLTYLRQETDQLNSDQLLNSERWEFSYDADGLGATTQAWFDENGDGESYLAVSGVLTMRSVGTLNQLYHLPLAGDVYHATPLPFAIASGLIF